MHFNFLGERCELFLAKSTYAPGDAITGRVHCHFEHENEVRNIYLRFKGKSKVHWKEGKTNYNDEVVYFEMESVLLQDKTTFPPGDYAYPFSFGLTCNIPSSASGTYGEIKYTAQATIDRPFAPDYTSEKEFKVSSPLSLRILEYNEPLVVSEVHIPTWAFFSKDPIRLTVTVPKRNYTIMEMVTFSAKLENFSKINVKEVQFKLVQGFSYFTQEHSKHSDEWQGQEYAIIDSVVESNTQKSWDLELRIPQVIFAGDLSFSRIMKAFWELRGEVILPFPNYNFKIKIPLQVGIAPE